MISVRKRQRIWLYLRQHRVMSIAAGQLCVMMALGVMLLVNVLGLNMFGAFAQSRCAGNARAYTVVRGDTLSRIAARYHTSWQYLASYNHIRDANLIYVAQTVCIPGAGATHPTGGNGGGWNNGALPIRGRGNFFPYGQCTWYAAERYYQMHGIFVPWTTNSNAWEWLYRARDFHWRVSGTPTVGAIIDLQPWVQGAYGLGHVAVVERVLGNGYVIASTMNWGAYYWRVTYVTFRAGSGVSFITF